MSNRFIVPVDEDGSLELVVYPFEISMFIRPSRGTETIEISISDDQRHHLIDVLKMCDPKYLKNGELVVVKEE